MLYWLTRRVARLALRWYYRNVEVLGLERIPTSGAALLVANHTNALVDALVVLSVIRRPVRLTAKATLLENPLTRTVVRALHIVPLRRTSDERSRSSNDAPNLQRNAEAFTDVSNALAAGELVLIFPEGKSHSEPELAPLKTGCARMVLHARLTHGLGQLSIIPIGLTFENKSRPRTRVVMHIGSPLQTDDVDPASTSSVNIITNRIDTALRGVTLNFPTSDDASRVLELSSLLTRLLDRVRPVHAPDPPLADSVRVARRIEQLRQILPSVPKDVLQLIDVFVSRLDAFRDAIRSLGIPANDLWMSTSVGSGIGFAARELAIIILLGPISLWGRINHWLPLRLARFLGRATSRNPDEPAMHTLVSGVVLVLLFYAGVAITIGLSIGWWISLLYLVSLPPAASIHFAFSDRMRNVRRRARTYLEFRRNPDRQRILIADAAWLRAEALRLDAALDGRLRAG